MNIMLRRALLEERLAESLAAGDRELVSRTRVRLADLMAGRRERFLPVLDLIDGHHARASRARSEWLGARRGTLAPGRSTQVRPSAGRRQQTSSEEEQSDVRH